jgi:hypothetical protein
MTATSIDSASNERSVISDKAQIMTNTVSAMTISDEISSEVATAILTKQKELNRDPKELLKIVLTVHDTLRQLSAQASQKRRLRIDRVPCAGS